MRAVLSSEAVTTRSPVGSNEAAETVPPCCSGLPIGKPLQHGGTVSAASFDPTGERVVTASDDKTARIWRAPPTSQALVERILKILGPRAPEPLRLPESASRQENYSTLMALGM